MGTTASGLNEEVQEIFSDLAQDAHIDRKAVTDAKGRILAYTYRWGALEKGEGNNVVELFRHGVAGSVLVCFDHPSGDAFIRHIP